MLRPMVSRARARITQVSLGATLSALGAVPAFAALPASVAPSTAPAAGNWLEYVKGYVKDGGLVLGLAISVIGLLWVSYMTIAKFNAARVGQAEWAEVGVLAIGGGGVLLFITFLLTQASTII